MKKCTKCGEMKKLVDYRRSKKTKDGHMAQCNKCQGTMDREYNKSEAGKTRFKRLDEKRKGDPRVRVRALTRRYIALGKINKAKKCCMCGNTTELESHHLQYKVNEIVFMCRKCHKKTHSKITSELRVTVPG